MVGILVLAGWRRAENLNIPTFFAHVLVARAENKRDSTIFHVHPCCSLAFYHVVGSLKEAGLLNPRWKDWLEPLQQAMLAEYLGALPGGTDDGTIPANAAESCRHNYDATEWLDEPSARDRLITVIS